MDKTHTANPDVDKYYQKIGAWFIDLLFDKGYLHPDLTRGSMREIENLLGMRIQHECDFSATMAKITPKLRGVDDG